MSSASAQHRLVPDDTLLVFLSDCHIGGDPGHDIFETPDDLCALLEDLAGHPGALELVLAGDFFDLLRISAPPAGRNKAASTLDREEYRPLFEALRRLASGERRRVVYLPGNHDAEVWWNKAIQAELLGRGLVHEFALSYRVAFTGDPQRAIYCEHGNQYDPFNTFADFADPLDTPPGDHVVTDILPRLPEGKTLGSLHLRQLPLVFPLSTVPEWIAGRLFYAFLRLALLWLLVPLTLAYAGLRLLDFAFGLSGEPADVVLTEVAYDGLLVAVVFGVFLLLARRFANAFIQGDGEKPGIAPAAEVALIARDLARGSPPPLGRGESAPIGVFVSGHTHVPALDTFTGPDGRRGFQVNSGCWLRQLQPVETRLRAPTVFVSRYVQTHVRVRREGAGTTVELWAHPRPFREELLFVEWLVVAEHGLHKRDADQTPRVIARGTLDDADGSVRQENSEA